LATKAKKSAPAKTSTAKVTRITARDIEKVVTKKPTTEKVVNQPKEGASKNPFVALGGYFKGAWFELQQVTWPSRKATWSLTLALLGFTAFFAVVILLLDAGFQYLFQLILG
jgi:preprotein translocase subunit SecE